MRIASLILVLFVLCRIPVQAQNRTGILEIIVEPFFAGQPLVLDKQMYHAATGDSLYMEMCRFYLSSIRLNAKDYLFAEKDSYHLVDAEEIDSRIIVLKNVPTGRYRALDFQVGTDSVTNVAGAMGGDLDPTRGMYWAWNTGYINVKIEGRSNSCPTRNHVFEFHIGGYMPPYQTVRSVELPLKNIRVRENKTTTIRLRVNLEQFFGKVSLRQTHSVMIPSNKAVELADYFKNIFFVQKW